jgi:hypothetical protein
MKQINALIIGAAIALTTGFPGAAASANAATFGPVNPFYAPSALPFHAPPTLQNTFVAMEKSGRLLARVLSAFRGVSDANTNPTLQSATNSATRSNSIRNRCAWSKALMTNSFTPVPTCRIRIRHGSGN